MSRVDVIIPVFNTPLRYVGPALDSLRAQTLADWTAWVINDGSLEAYTGELQEFLRGYNDTRINYLYSDHKGPGGSRNVGIERGEAPYVALLDSDDVWLPHHLAGQVGLLDQNPDIGLVHGHFENIDSDSNPLPPPPRNIGINELNAPQFLADMLRRNRVAASSVVVRRTFLERVGGFDGTFPCLVDKELWLRLLDAGAKFHYDPQVLFLYRIHPNNVSKKTDVLLKTRSRMIEKAERIVLGNPAFSSIDWKSLKRQMTVHMYREAAAEFLARGQYSRSIRYCLPAYSGISLNSLRIFLKALCRLVIGSPAASRAG
jgi:glycosyltransferase involved in cell wall biosynthesis